MTDLRYQNVTSDQQELSEVAAKLFDGSRDDPSRGSDLGLFGIGIGTEFGGSGGSAKDLAIIVEAAGAALASSNVADSTMVTAPLFIPGSGLSSAIQQQWLDGQLCVSLPVASPWQVAADLEARDGRIFGRWISLGAGRPDLVVVPVAGPDVDQLLLFDAHTKSSFDINPIDGVDVTRTLTEVRADGVQFDDAVACVTGPSLFRQLMARRATAVALDAVGAARSAFARTLTYAAVRTQFDQHIGSFQAYQHRCANAYIELTMAQSLAFAAADAIGTPEGVLLGLAAGRRATGNATFVCGEAVQLHGGIGFTWEAGIHAFLKRSRMNEIIGRGCARARAALIESDNEYDSNPIELGDEGTDE